MSRPYEIIFSLATQKSLDRLSDAELAPIESAINDLSLNQLNTGNIKKLKGLDNLYRKRVGDFRIIFEIRHGQEQIDILAVGQRGDIYRP